MLTCVLHICIHKLNNMQEVIVIVCVIALVLFFFSSYELKIDEDDV